MENPVLAAVINDLPLLLNNPDLTQHLLDLLRADLDLTAVHSAVAAAQLENLRRLEALLRGFPMSAEDRAAWTDAVEQVAASVDAIQSNRRQLALAVALLVVVRAAAYGRGRARLLPGLLLGAASAAAVPGFRSFVRFSVLMLGFLFRF